MDDPQDCWDQWVSQAQALLSGFVGERDGLPVHQYLDPKDEEYGRMALATVLSTGRPPLSICKALAALISPDKECAAATLRAAHLSEESANRTLQFGFRKKGDRASLVMRDSEIFRRIYEVLLGKESNHNVESAIAAVTQEIWPSDPDGKHEENVRRIWQKYKSFRDWRDNDSYFKSER